MLRNVNRDALARESRPGRKLNQHKSFIRNDQILPGPYLEISNG